MRAVYYGERPLHESERVTSRSCERWFGLFIALKRWRQWYGAAAGERFDVGAVGSSRRATSDNGSTRKRGYSQPAAFVR
jgi:hypothetical protein